MGPVAEEGMGGLIFLYNRINEQIYVLVFYCQKERLPLYPTISLMHLFIQPFFTENMGLILAIMCLGLLCLLLNLAPKNNHSCIWVETPSLGTQNYMVEQKWGKTQKRRVISPYKGIPKQPPPPPQPKRNSPLCPQKINMIQTQTESKSQNKKISCG